VKYRSIDACWGLDETINLSNGFCGNGYLYINGLKIKICGEKKGIRIFLINADILSLGFGDGVYRYHTDWNSGGYYWKVVDGKVCYSGCLVKDEVLNHFVAMFEGGKYNVMLDFTERNRLGLINNKELVPLQLLFFGTNEYTRYYSIVSSVFREFFGYSIEEEYVSNPS